MNAINLRDVIKPIDGDSVAETITVNHRAGRRAARRRPAGGCSPSSTTRTSAGASAPRTWLLAEELRFFEVYNGHPGVRNYGDDDARLRASGSGTSCWPCGWASTGCRSSTAWRPTTPTATTPGASARSTPAAAG